MKKLLFKKAISGLLFFLFVPLTFGLASCGNNPSQSSDHSSVAAPSFSVYLYGQSDIFSVEGDNPILVPRGEDAKFVIRLSEKFAVERLLRDKEEIAYSSKALPAGMVELTIPNIRYSQLIEVACEKASGTIDYFPNGGQYLDGRDATSPYSARHAMKSRLRPNTEIGTDMLTREGYLLTGWNTESDGSGEDIGLGSRATIHRPEHLALYAKWEKESPKSDFEYEIHENGVEITAYHGGSKAVVPSFIDGRPVTSIAPSSFCGDEEYVYLPPIINEVKENAFSNSGLKELWLFDNLRTISDFSFSSCADFKHVHINAIEPPRFGGSNLYSEYHLADKYDLLILNKEEKKLIVFGGSGAFISVDTLLMEEQLSDTVCLNMAVNGWFNAIAQIEMMLPYLSSGDMFLHIPEPSSQFGLFYGTTMIPFTGDFDYNMLRLYYCLESNYDLIGLVDLRHVSNFFGGFQAFNAYRFGLKPTTYQDYPTRITTYGQTYANDFGYIDSRGNWALPRPAGVNPKEAGEADAVVEYLTDPAARSRAKGYFSQLEEKGVQAFLAMAPTNQDTLEDRLENPDKYRGNNEGDYLHYGRPEGIPDPDYPNVSTWIEDFDSELSLTFGDHVIASLSQTLFATDDYYEPDYHLSDNAVPAYTSFLLSALQNKIQGGHV